MTGGATGLHIAVEDPRAADVRRLLERHLAFAREVTPAEGVHALDVDGLVDPSVVFLGARRDGELVGVGALKLRGDDHGELKSMHTAIEARGRGVGRALVDRLLEVAAERGCRRVSLETGSMAAFDAARRLYARAGFVDCEPFDEYRFSATSACMTIELGPENSNISP